MRAVMSVDVDVALIYILYTLRFTSVCVCVFNMVYFPAIQYHYVISINLRGMSSGGERNDPGAYTQCAHIMWLRSTAERAWQLPGSKSAAIQPQFYIYIDILSYKIVSELYIVRNSLRFHHIQRRTQHIITFYIVYAMTIL